jgi:hypothetical protein
MSPKAKRAIAGKTASGRKSASPLEARQVTSLDSEREVNRTKVVIPSCYLCENAKMSQVERHA